MAHARLVHGNRVYRCTMDAWAGWRQRVEAARRIKHNLRRAAGPASLTPLILAH